jgi:hypothetical protein
MTESNQQSRLNDPINRLAVYVARRSQISQKQGCAGELVACIAMTVGAAALPQMAAEALDLIVVPVWRRYVAAVGPTDEVLG